MRLADVRRAQRKHRRRHADPTILTTTARLSKKLILARSTDLPARPCRHDLLLLLLLLVGWVDGVGSVAAHEGVQGEPSCWEILALWGAASGQFLVIVNKAMRQQKLIDGVTVERLVCLHGALSEPPQRLTVTHGILRRRHTTAALNATRKPDADEEVVGSEYVLDSDVQGHLAHSVGEDGALLGHTRQPVCGALGVVGRGRREGGLLVGQSDAHVGRGLGALVLEAVEYDAMEVEQRHR
mmetsp:Transcript_26611/g.76339  ORF Transcript_26611/g.76339 Transcript_26611/m.76339 type:complete len:240 (-) Transcript_26611:99-818(-)